MTIYGQAFDTEDLDENLYEKKALSAISYAIEQFWRSYGLSCGRMSFAVEDVGHKLVVTPTKRAGNTAGFFNVKLV